LLYKLILILMPFSLFSAVSIEQRDLSDAANIRYGQTPSNIPTGGLLKDLKNTSVMPFEKADVSAHPSKHVYMGYGLYDPTEENCAEADVPSIDGTDPVLSGRFLESQLKIFNGHAYLKSADRMGYSQCKSWANNYYAYPAVITTAAENDFLANVYSDFSYWVGLTQPSATSPFINAKGDSQDFFSFNIDDSTYYSTKSNVTKAGRDWYKASGTEANYCVIEFETEDYKKPVKLCAPWWSIERTYKQPSESRYLVASVDENGNPTTVDIRKFNQSDYPRRLRVCIRREVTPAVVTPGEKQKVVCNSYYDVDRSPRCQENLIQDLCYVNECRGAVIDSCVPVSVEDAPLTYSKKLVIDKDGNEVWIKDRDQIKMHSYECDAFTATAACLEYQDVTMLPQPCPGSHADPTDTSSKPLRVYGSARRAIYNSDGTIQKLQGVCPNGDFVDVPIDILSRNSRVCKRYDWVEQKTTWSESCSHERAYTDYSVPVALTEHDAYADDPNCVRLNNIQDAQPERDMIIRYMRKGYASLDLKKAYIEGTEDDFSPVPISTGYIDHVLKNMVFSVESNQTASTPQLTPAQQSELEDMQIDCSETGPIFSRVLNEFMDELHYYRLQKKFGISGSLFLPSNLNKRVIVKNNVTWSQCQDIASRMSETEHYSMSLSASPIVLSLSSEERDWQNRTYSQIAVTQSYLNGNMRLNDLGVNVVNMVTPESDPLKYGSCPMVLTIDSQINQMRDVTGHDPYTTTIINQIPFEGCLIIAYCTHSDILSPMNYSGYQDCNIRFGTGMGDTTEQWQSDRESALIEHFAKESNPPILTPYEVRSKDEDTYYKEIVSNPLSIDGSKDIFFLEEYVEPLRGWGYLPSYNFLMYKSAYVTANNKQIWPVINHYPMREELKLDWYNWRKTYHFYGTSSDFVNATAFVGDSGGWKSRSESYAYNLLSGGTGWLVSSLITIFSGPHKEFEANVQGTIYQDKRSLRRYIPNYYQQYEARSDDPNDYNRITYAQMSYKTGSRYSSSDSTPFYATTKEIIDDFMESLNVYSPSGAPYTNGLPYDFTNLNLGYKSLDWWDIYAVKKRTKVSEDTTPIWRYVTTHYMGAVNGVGIVVPYTGDYEVRAYDQYGSELSYAIVPKGAFVSRSGGMISAPAMLGTYMNIVTSESGSCRNEIMTVVGGGVSGGYSEINDNYSPYTRCDDANHLYVEEHAISQIKIKVANTDKFYVIDLKYPLPYVNRVFLVSMGFSEVREYRCFQNDFGVCNAFEKTE